jgi:hypothetical protein
MVFTLREDNWHSLVPYLSLGATAVALLATFQISQLLWQSNRDEAYAELYAYSSVLEIAAPLAAAWLWSSGRRAASVLPLMALGGAALVLQARLMFVEMLVLGSIFLLLNRPVLSPRRVAVVCLGLSAAILSGYMVWYCACIQSELPASVRGLWERRAVDSRTDQARQFFAKVPLTTFLWGTGITAEGEFDSTGSAGIDCGYVNILFRGGVPALLLFFALHILAAIRCLTRRLDPIDAACVASVFSYGVRFCSSTLPSFSPQYCILILLSGRCMMLAFGDRTRSDIPLNVVEAA